MMVQSAMRSGDYAPSEQVSDSPEPQPSGPRSRNSARANGSGKTRGESATVMIFLLAMLIFCVAGVVFLGTCARVYFQGHQLVRISQELQTAQADHDNLTRKLAQLESAQRIGPRAQAMNMALEGATRYINTSAPTQIARGQ